MSIYGIIQSSLALSPRQFNRKRRDPIAKAAAASRKPTRRRLLLRQFSPSPKLTLLDNFPNAQKWVWHQALDHDLHYATYPPTSGGGRKTPDNIAFTPGPGGGPLKQHQQQGLRRGRRRAQQQRASPQASSRQQQLFSLVLWRRNRPGALIIRLLGDLDARGPKTVNAMVPYEEDTLQY